MSNNFGINKILKFTQKYYFGKMPKKKTKFQRSANFNEIWLTSVIFDVEFR